MAGVLRERVLGLVGGSVSLGRRTVALLIWGKMRAAARCEEGVIQRRGLGEGRRRRALGRG